MQKSNFTVIEDEREIKQAQLTFAKNMQKEATKDGEIIAGHQGGQGEKLHAYWFKDNKFWWAYKPVPNEKIPRWWNSFSARKTLLHRNGEPHWNKTNGITCEINSPLSGNTWQTAGVFVKDQDNKIYIAHTGKIGGGRAGVGKTTFVDNFPGKNKWHQVSGSRGEKNVVIVSNINDPKLIDNVGFFVKAVEKLKPGKNSNDEFEFVKKDFDSIGSTKKVEATYRGNRLRKLSKVLKTNLSSSFDGINSYVGRSQTPHESIKGVKGKKKHLPYSWLGIWFGKEKYDTLQFQAALGLHGLTQKPIFSAGIYLDNKATKTRPEVCELIRKQRDECFTILKNLPSEYVVKVENEDKNLREEWKISKLKAKDMDVIVDALSVKKTSLNIARHFTEKKALDMKTTIVYEVSDVFEKLFPLHKFLTVQDSSSGDMNLDKKVEGWLKRGARLAGQSIEDYTRYLGKDEYEARYKTYSKLKVVLEKEPIDLVELSTVSKVTTCIGAGSTVFW